MRKILKVININELIKPVLIVIILLSYVSVFNQTRIVSPYSKYGLGDLEIYKFRSNSGIGYLHNAYSDALTVNYLNPASYTGFDSASFVFETAIISDFYRLQTTALKQNGNYTSLGYLSFGFPLMKRWKAALGLIPFSNMGYKIQENIWVDNVGNINYIFEGDGGVKQLYFGNAFKIGKNLSVGLNISYFFGSFERIQSIYFPDEDYNYAAKFTDRTTVNDFHLNYGLQHRLKLSKKYSLMTGLSFALSDKINIKNSNFVERLSKGTYSYSAYDTLGVSEAVKTDFNLPLAIGFGFVLSNNNKWNAGVDVDWQQWSEYRYAGRKDSLTDMLQLAAGFELIPDISSVSGYWQKVKYRFGIRYAQSYLKFNTIQINEAGLSLGMVFPLKRSKTGLSAAIEVGQRGTTDHNLISEQYCRLTLALSVYEKWFVKRKYE